MTAEELIDTLQGMIDNDQIAPDEEVYISLEQSRRDRTYEIREAMIDEDDGSAKLTIGEEA